MKKLSLFVGSALLISSVAACSSVAPVTSVNGNVNFQDANMSEVKFTKLMQNLNKQGIQPNVIDLGAKGGGSFAVKIDFASSFKTKANAPGHLFTKADVDFVKVFLTTTAVTPGVASNGTLTPVAAMGPFIIAKSPAVQTAIEAGAGGPFANASTFVQSASSASVGAIGGVNPINIVFKNVPGAASPYRVAMSASTIQAPAGGSAAAPRNITLNAGGGATGIWGTFDDAGIYPAVAENYVLTNTGGDGATGGIGAVSFNPADLQFTDTVNTPATTLAGAITLIPADGATVDSLTTINNGSATPGAAVTAG